MSIFGIFNTLRAFSVSDDINRFFQKKHIVEHFNLAKFLIKLLRKVSSHNLA